MNLFIEFSPMLASVMLVALVILAATAGASAVAAWQLYRIANAIEDFCYPDPVSEDPPVAAPGLVSAFGKEIHAPVSDHRAA